MDVAEQALTGLESLSKKHSKAILQAVSIDLPQLHQTCSKKIHFNQCHFSWKHTLMFTILSESV
jgi:hypothetical protein